MTSKQGFVVALLSAALSVVMAVIASTYYAPPFGFLIAGGFFLFAAVGFAVSILIGEGE